MTDQERKPKILSALKSLQNHNGWKMIANVLKENIKATQEQINGGDPQVQITTVEQLEFLRKTLKDREYLLAMPEELIEEYSDESKEFPINLDPFE